MHRLTKYKLTLVKCESSFARMGRNPSRDVVVNEKAVSKEGGPLVLGGETLKRPQQPVLLLLGVERLTRWHRPGCRLARVRAAARARPARRGGLQWWRSCCPTN